MQDTVHLEGVQAYIDGKSKDDCPYGTTYNRYDYWNCPASLRQRWLTGFSSAKLQNTLIQMRGTWPREL